jgi:hypothetical protein
LRPKVRPQTQIGHGGGPRAPAMSSCTSLRRSSHLPGKIIASPRHPAVVCASPRLLAGRARYLHAGEQNRDVNRPALHSAIVAPKSRRILFGRWRPEREHRSSKMTIRVLATLFRDAGVRKLSNHPCWSVTDASEEDLKYLVQNAFSEWEAGPDAIFSGGFPVRQGSSRQFRPPPNRGSARRPRSG